MKFQVNSVSEMHQLGAKIGTQLKPSDVVVLTGDLGAGKTVLTQGIASAFGVENVTSPTFVISRVYKGKPNFIHADAYRLLDSPIGGLQDLDLDVENSVTVVEWGKNFASQLNDQYLVITISIIDELSRELKVSSVGDRWKSFNL